LRSAGIATPEIVAFLVYRAGSILRRGDVLTREVHGEDLGAALDASASSETRNAALESAAALVASLSRAGAHHADLNLRNILISNNAAYILDIDRVRFHVPGDPIVMRANIERLQRSLRKRRDIDGLPVDENEIVAIGARVMELAQ
jgi:predicted Ser/Thr protein kinase